MFSKHFPLEQSPVGSSLQVGGNFLFLAKLPASLDFDNSLGQAPIFVMASSIGPPEKIVVVPLASVENT
jgi:hypothetical protein